MRNLDLGDEATTCPHYGLCYHGELCNMHMRRPLSYAAFINTSNLFRHRSEEGGWFRSFVHPSVLRRR